MPATCASPRRIAGCPSDLSLVGQTIEPDRHYGGSARPAPGLLLRGGFRVPSGWSRRPMGLGRQELQRGMAGLSARRQLDDRSQSRPMGPGGERSDLEDGDGGRSRSGRPLRPVNPPICHTERIRWEGPDRFQTRWEDGTEHRLSRCKSPADPQIRCLGDCDRATPFDEKGWAAGPAAATRRCR
jgi:hypothetical protein